MTPSPLGLDDLIRSVEDSSESDEPLERLSTAMGVKADVDDLTDSLIGHFVDQARRAGRSWSDIGAAMGVTKQAAQQRHGVEGFFDRLRRRSGGMFTRFTGRAKNVVAASQGEAQALGHSWLGTEHLLLSLFTQPEGLAAKALAALGVERDAVLDKVVEAVPRGDGAVKGSLPFTPLAKRALESSLQEALRLGHNYIGTEHLVLGLLKVEDGVAARVLTELGVQRDPLQREIIRLLTRVSG